MASSHGTAFPDGEQVEVRSRLPVALPEKQRHQVRKKQGKSRKIGIRPFCAMSLSPTKVI